MSKELRGAQTNAWCKLSFDISPHRHPSRIQCRYSRCRPPTLPFPVKNLNIVMGCDWQVALRKVYPSMSSCCCPDSTQYPEVASDEQNSGKQRGCLTSCR